MAVTGVIVSTFENRTAATPTTVIAAPGAAQRIRVLSLTVSAPAAAAVVNFGDTGFEIVGDPGWRWGQLGIGQTSPTQLVYNPSGWFVCGVGKGLVANGPVTGSVAYEVLG